MSILVSISCYSMDTAAEKTQCGRDFSKCQFTPRLRRDSTRRRQAGIPRRRHRHRHRHGHPRRLPREDRRKDVDVSGGRRLPRSACHARAGHARRCSPTCPPTCSTRALFLARMSVSLSVSVPWNISLTTLPVSIWCSGCMHFTE